MKTSELLIKAKALIADEKNWTRHAFARIANGDRTHSLDKEATCFCGIGAVVRVTHTEGSAGYIKAGYLLAKAANVRDFTDFNDSHTHAEVMGVWDKAIELAKAEE